MPQEHPELLRISDLPDVEADYYGLALSCSLRQNPPVTALLGGCGKTNLKSDYSPRNIQLSPWEHMESEGRVGNEGHFFCHVQNCWKESKISV